MQNIVMRWPTHSAGWRTQMDCINYGSTHISGPQESRIIQLYYLYTAVEIEMAGIDMTRTNRSLAIYVKDFILLINYYSRNIFE